MTGRAHQTIANRACGASSVSNVRNYFRQKYGGGMNLSLLESVDIQTRHHNGSMTSLDIDMIDGRYLLSGAVDGHVSVYDVSTVETYGKNTSGENFKTKAPRAIPPVACSKKQEVQSATSSHSHMVSSVQWYPIDTGIFVSACMGGIVNLWDTNNMSVVAKFRVGNRINACRMSSISKYHNLIAVGCNESAVRLCDMRTSSNNHILQGHRGEILSLAWSPVDEFIIATGSDDCSLRLWDIRSSGLKACTYIYDLHDTKGIRHRASILKNFSDDRIVKTNRNGTNMQHQSSLHIVDHGFDSISNFRRNRRSSQQSSKKGAGQGHITSHLKGVKSVEYTPDGLFLVSCCANNITLWDTYMGTNQLIHYPDFKASYCGKSSPLKVLQPGKSYDAHIVAPINKSGDIILYNLHQGSISARLQGHYETITDIVIRDMGGSLQLFSSSQDGNILVWH